MHFVIAPDSFKESLSALDAANAIEAGFREIFPDASYVKIPVADGGEGTVDAMIAATGGRRVALRATGPLGQPVDAFYGLTGGDVIAVIEMAAASGLELVPPGERDPLRATSRGTGELILAALDAGARHFILGVGGSATNDGGAGMLQALGVGLFDAHGAPLAAGGAALAQLARIDLSQRDPRILDSVFEVACDVSNPLVGPTGASAVFGPQKGATPAMVAQLDANLRHYAAIIARDVGQEGGEDARRDAGHDVARNVGLHAARDTGQSVRQGAGQDLAEGVNQTADQGVRQALHHDVANVPGAGAGGGIAAAMLVFLHGRLRPGSDIVADAVGLDAAVQLADLVITGEGRIDSQTVNGKTPIGVARVAQRHGKPVIAIGGCLGLDASAVHAHGIDATFSTIMKASTVAEALAGAEFNLRSTARNIAATLKLGTTLHHPNQGQSRIV